MRHNMGVLKKIRGSNQYQTREQPALVLSTPPADLMIQAADQRSLSCSHRGQLAFVDPDQFPVAAAETLLEDSIAVVRGKAITHPGISQEIIREVFNRDRDWWVRMGIANNPNTPVDILAQLSTDPDPALQAQAQGRLSVLHQDDVK